MLGLFNKVAGVVLATATAVWAWDQIPPPASWDVSGIEWPTVHVPDVELPDVAWPKIDWPKIELPNIDWSKIGLPDWGEAVPAPPDGKPQSDVAEASTPEPRRKPDRPAETAENEQTPETAAKMFAAGTGSEDTPDAVVAAPAPPMTGPIGIRLAGDHTRDRLAGVVDWIRLRSFYAQVGYAPVWTGGARQEANAALALAALKAADTQGLDADDYFAGARTLAEVPPPPALAVDFELLITDGLLRYAQDVRVGRVRTNPADPTKAFVPQTFDAARALHAALKSGELGAFLTDLPPRYPQYRALVAALARYHTNADTTSYPARIPATPPIDLAGSDPRLALLRQRLTIEDGNLSPVAPAYGGNDGLRGAVMRFQERNGLPVDGFVGTDTLEMLNARPVDRIAQIAANMERWRWLPHEEDPRAIFVQVPEATIRFVEQGNVVLESRAIFGRPGNDSPAMGVKATAITVNPPWHAPESITVNELLPALRNDRNFLRDQNMVLIGGPAGDPYGYSIDWNSVSSRGFPYAIQQRAGAESALGRIKFEMPNNYIVYLHDTPDHYFFGLPNHALSHGCIRVDRPFELAALALGGDEREARTKIDTLVAAGQTRRIDLPKPIPVYIVYLTAIATPDGSVRFYPDLYRRDGAVKAALRSGAALAPGL